MDEWSWKRKRSWVLAMTVFFTQDTFGGDCGLWLCRPESGVVVQQEVASKSGVLTWLVSLCPRSGAKRAYQFVGLVLRNLRTTPMDVTISEEVLGEVAAWGLL